MIKKYFLTLDSLWLATGNINLNTGLAKILLSSIFTSTFSIGHCYYIIKEAKHEWWRWCCNKSMEYDTLSLLVAKVRDIPTINKNTRLPKLLSISALIYQGVRGKTEVKN